MGKTISPDDVVSVFYGSASPLPVKKNGYTLIELLASVAIVSILLGISIPAIQRVREISRNVSCQNTLRQIAIAAFGYESAHQVFPPGQLGPTTIPVTLRDFNENQMVGHMGFLLPYLEQEHFSHLIFSGVSLSNNSMGPAWYLDSQRVATANRRIQFLRCPSDLEESDPTIVILGSTTGGFLPYWPIEPYHGWTNYLGSSGTIRPSGRIPGPIVHETGIFFTRSRVGLRDVIDGASNTIMFGELTGGTSNFDGEKFGQCRKRHSFLGNGMGSEFGLLEGFAVYPIGSNEDYSLFCFSSRHVGRIVNFTYVDGSTHSINRGIDWDIFCGMMTRNGNEIPKGLNGEQSDRPLIGLSP